MAESFRVEVVAGRGVPLAEVQRLADEAAAEEGETGLVLTSLSPVAAGVIEINGRTFNASALGLQIYEALYS